MTSVDGDGERRRATDAERRKAAEQVAALKRKVSGTRRWLAAGSAGATLFLALGALPQPANSNGQNTTNSGQVAAAKATDQATTTADSSALQDGAASGAQQTSRLSTGAARDGVRGEESEHGGDDWGEGEHGQGDEEDWFGASGAQQQGERLVLVQTSQGVFVVRLPAGTTLPGEVSGNSGGGTSGNAAGGLSSGDNAAGAQLGGSGTSAVGQSSGMGSSRGPHLRSSQSLP